jgi:hypothetical protein
MIDLSAEITVVEEIIIEVATEVADVTTIMIKEEEITIITEKGIINEVENLSANFCIFLLNYHIIAFNSHFKLDYNRDYDDRDEDRYEKRRKYDEVDDTEKKLKSLIVRLGKLYS